MAFIEPRLIHLLNDSATPHLAHVDLPPFAEGFPDSSDRPLPLEPTTGREEQHRIHGGLGGHHATAFSSSSIPDDGVLLARDGKREGDHASDRRFGSNAQRIPLRLLLGEPDVSGSSFTSRGSADEFVASSADPVSKKRQRVLAGKDDLVHLPQPVKKQKAVSQPLLPTMPPIINGLHEPPPNAALFPPISSNDFDNPEATRHNQGQDCLPVLEDRSGERSPKSHKSGGGKQRKKAMKPRRKWSEVETTHLLLGVSRHGVGKWTDILADPEFTFNNRTAGDLKDRFRTCCPDELRKNAKENKTTPPADPLPTPPSESKGRAKTGLLSENILIAPDDNLEQDACQPQVRDHDGCAKAKKSRAHRKKMEDLAELGIHGPFKKSHRRERRPFTEQDDGQILEGLENYGPAWTKIQRDPRFGLSARQPTDLRDRVRNKYPEVYQNIEKGLLQAKEATASDGSELPSSNLAGETGESAVHSAPSASLLRTDSKGDLSRAPDKAEPLVAPQSFDLGETSDTTLMVNAGEMDISRLLLNDAQSPGMAPRHLASDLVPDAANS